MTWVVDEPERLDRFLARMLPEHSRTKIARQITADGAQVEGEVVYKPGIEVRPGWTISFGEIPESPAHDLTPIPMELDIRYEDDDLLVINKPRGLVVHPAPGLDEPTLVQGLLARGQSLSQGSAAFRPGIVHRLDKLTTGLIIVAKSDQSHQRLAEGIKLKQTERRYVAVVHGKPPHERFSVDAPIGRNPRNPTAMAVTADGKSAITHFKVINRLDRGTLVAARLETGRTHQIRVHLAHFGLPVLGDQTYAPAPFHSGSMQLHAAFLQFLHPTTGESVVVYAEPPADFLGVEYVGREVMESW